MTHLQISEYIKKEFLNSLESTKIKNLDDLINLSNKLLDIRSFLFLKGYPTIPYYRGEQNIEWDILPGISRPPFNKGFEKNKLRKIEKNGVQLFTESISETYDEKLLFPLNSTTKFHKYWDILFQAQHAGVKTNLIDLSTSMPHSAYFACEQSEKYDELSGQLWCILVPKENIVNASESEDTYPDFDPFKLPKSFVCNVSTYMDTIQEKTYQLKKFKQHGSFFASADNDLDIPLNKKEFWKNMIIRVEIRPEVKKKIIKELIEIKISKSSLSLEKSETETEMINSINEEIKNV
jgi:hypothetical protein